MPTNFGRRFAATGPTSGPTLEFRLDKVSYYSTLAMIKSLPKKMQRKVLRSVMGTVGTKLKKAVQLELANTLMNTTRPSQRRFKDGTPRKPLKETIIRKVKTYRKSGQVIAIIGPEAGAAPHANIVESGSYQTAPPGVISGERFHTDPSGPTPGKSTGVMPANPFMRRTWSAYKPRLGRLMASETRRYFRRHFRPSALARKARRQIGRTLGI